MRLYHSVCGDTLLSRDESYRRQSKLAPDMRHRTRVVRSKGAKNAQYCLFVLAAGMRVQMCLSHSKTFPILFLFFFSSTGRQWNDERSAHANRKDGRKEGRQRWVAA